MVRLRVLDEVDPARCVLLLRVLVHRVRVTVIQIQMRFLLLQELSLSQLGLDVRRRETFWN